MYYVTNVSDYFNAFKASQYILKHSDAPSLQIYIRPNANTYIYINAYFV